ncbi:HHR179Cp [Eremothecium sinecaudum]|uniref:EKC/KEOPS complex subunit CGI121 n=1 Tax=Eremothecium sinecaudum TaxID=45286 RepID=A0A109V0G3_9SACH|nr:HHR179Cp [Eremothecium sinecaudum]AMD22948.1 HHR179Cp [Eremothecium sinecaudum]
MLDLKLPQFPNTELHIALFEEVANVAELRDNVANLPYSFIDARSVVSKEQLLSAIYRALIEKQYNKLRTMTLHSEFILCLSPNSNIGESFKKFGLKEDSKAVIVLKATTPDETFDKEELLSLMHGKEVEFSNEKLLSYADINLIKKNYKLTGFEPESDEDLSAALVHAIQLRGL